MGHKLHACRQRMIIFQQVSLVKRLMSRHTMGTPGLMGKDVTTVIVKAHIITHNYMQSETNTALIH